MTSAGLQGIALATMVVDHVGLAFFPEAVWLRWVGRVSFPLFLFLLSEGFVHTSHRRRYALRLALFALVSEGPYQLFVYGGFRALPCQNVFFALLCALLALGCVERGGLWWLGGAGLAVAAELLGMDYGAYGILLAVCFFLFRGSLPGTVASLGACTGAYCLAHQGWVQGWAIAAAVPLALYNGERGRRLRRYVVYGFYPAHLLLLGLLRGGG